MKHSITVLMVIAILMSLMAIPGAQAQTGSTVLLEQLPMGDGQPFAADTVLCSTAWAFGCTAAANFSVLEGETLTIDQIQLWGVYYDAATYTDNFTVLLRQPQTDGRPGTPLYTEEGVASQRELAIPGGTQGFPYDGYLITLTLGTPQELVAGSYWVEIYNHGTFNDTGVNYFGWMEGGSDTFCRGLGSSATALEAPGATWWAENYELSLRLTGTTQEAVTPGEYTISGVVYDDLDADGSRDAGEVGIESVLVGLALNIDQVPFSHMSAYTGADGSFEFIIPEPTGGLPDGFSVSVYMEPISGLKFTEMPAPFASLTGNLTGMDIGIHIVVLTPVPERFADGVQVTSYSQTITVHGGDAPYTFTPSPTRPLPSGLAYTFDQQSGTITLSGTPAETGSFLAHVDFTDANGALGQVSEYFTIHPPLGSSPATLPDGSLGAAYDQTIVVSGGIAPYMFATGSEQWLPAGLALDTSSGSIVISGAPSAAGQALVDVYVTDQTGSTVEVQRMFWIKTSPSLTLTSSPNPSRQGQQVTLGLGSTATVAGWPAPWGQVTFNADGIAIPGCEGLWLGQNPELEDDAPNPVTCTTSSLGVGLHAITADLTTFYGPYNSATASLPTAQIVEDTPAPALTAHDPASAPAGSGGLALAVAGSDFTAGSVVRWNGADLATIYVNDTQLTATIPAANLAAVQTAQVTVFTPEPGGGTSNVLAFFVTEAAAEVTGQAVTSGDDPAATFGPATATATGSGLLVVAGYDANPGGTPSFTASGVYFDVYAAPGNRFSKVNIAACDSTASDKLFWWNAAQDKWVKASPQSYNQSSGCVMVVVDADSSPALSQLQGTTFAAGAETASNTAPVAVPGGPYLGAINTAIRFDGSGSSDADGDPLTYAWDFDDGTTDSGVQPPHSYTPAGIYNVCLTVNDGLAGSDPACTLAVAYDPSAGFVTGGGWIASPAGAYKLDLNLSGPATFGFVSKYKKGAAVPEGNTEFQFAVAGFSFHSETYEWLVVAGKTKAQFKGSGTVNGGLAPNGNAFKFMIWAGDGAVSGGSDTFRIRIWWEAGGVETDVYDNGAEQAIGGGSILIHTK